MPADGPRAPPDGRVPRAAGRSAPRPRARPPLPRGCRARVLTSCWKAQCPRARKGAAAREDASSRASSVALSLSIAVTQFVSLWLYETVDQLLPFWLSALFALLVALVFTAYFGRRVGCFDVLRVSLREFEDDQEKKRKAASESLQRLEVQPPLPARYGHGVLNILRIEQTGSPSINIDK